MKRYIKCATSFQIPAPFNQYYEIVSDKWLERNTGYDVEEFGYPCEDAPGYDIKHLAWAYAKDMYQNELLDNGMEAVELVQEGEEEPFLATLVHDRVIPVSTVDMPKAWE